MKSPVRVAVVGAGWWASKAHIPSLAIYDHSKLAAIVDPDEDTLRAAGKRADVRRLHTDYRDLFTGDIDAVVIAVPHAYHYEIARASLDAGLHVFVEKPMVLKAREARDLVQRADAAGLQLMVGYTFHFTRHTQLARELVQSGRLGDILFVSALFASSVEAFYRGQPHEYQLEDPVPGPLATTYSDPAIAGGGQGQTQITHAIDTVFWVSGLRAVEVTGYMANFHLNVDLVDALSYRLSNGAIGVMGSTGSIAPGMELQEEFRYYGTHGVLLHDLAKGKLSFLPNDGAPEVFADLEGEEIYPDREPARGFVDTILGTRENPAPGHAAALSVEFLEAAYRSARDARPVRIEELYEQEPALR